MEETAGSVERDRESKGEALVCLCAFEKVTNKTSTFY